MSSSIQLPEGLIDSLLSQLPSSILRYHLLNQLFKLPTQALKVDPVPGPDSNHKSDILLQSQIHAIGRPHKLHNRELQRVIFGNITKMTMDLFPTPLPSEMPPSNLILKLVVYNHLPNVTHLEIALPWLVATPMGTIVRPTNPIISSSSKPLDFFSKSLKYMSKLDSLSIHQISPNVEAAEAVLVDIFHGSHMISQANLARSNGPGLDWDSDQHEQPTFPALKTLSFEKSNLVWDQLWLLATQIDPLFPSLTTLDVSGCEVGNQMDILLRLIQHSMPQLTRLNLSSVALTRHSFSCLSLSPLLSNLTSINLSNNPGIDCAETLQRFFSCDRFKVNTGLIELHLNHFANLDGKGGSIFPLLFTHPHNNFAHLTTLSLTHCPMTQKNLLDIVQSPNLPKLEQLNLSAVCEGVEASVLESIFVSNQTVFSNLRDLQLPLPPKHNLTQSLVNTTEVDKLESLTIDLTDVSADDFESFVFGANVNNLTRLTLLCPNVSLHSLQMLSISCNFPNLRELSLMSIASSVDSNKWTDWFFESSSWLNLMRLELWSCSLNNQDLLNLSLSPYMSNLTDIVLMSEESMIDMTGVRYLAQSPYLSPTLNITVNSDGFHYTNIQPDEDSYTRSSLDLDEDYALNDYEDWGEIDFSA